MKTGRAACLKRETSEMTPHSVSVEIGGRPMTFETGVMAKQADGAVIVRMDDSAVLVTAVTGGPARFDFLPLTVEYQDRNGAYGTIPGNYFKREGRSNERETLVSRMIDRPIRPQFPKHYLSLIHISEPTRPN